MVNPLLWKEAAKPKSDDSEMDYGFIPDLITDLIDKKLEVNALSKALVQEGYKGSSVTKITNWGSYLVISVKTVRGEFEYKVEVKKNKGK